MGTKELHELMTMSNGFASLIQTGVLALVLLGLLLLYRRPTSGLLEAVATRIRKGSEFSFGNLFSIGRPPAEMLGAEEMAMTSGGSTTGALAKEISDELEQKRYPANVAESPYLVHVSEVVRPRQGSQSGLFRARVWLEQETDDHRSVKRVTYRLHDTFANKIVVSEAKSKDFELWLNLYGEFTVVAHVEMDGGSSAWLTR